MRSIFFAVVTASAATCFAGQSYITVWCNNQTGQVQVYQTSELSVLGIGLGVTNDDYTPRGSPLNGKTCKYVEGTGVQLGHPYTFSDATQIGVVPGPPSSSGQVRPAQMSSTEPSTSLVNTFPWMVPLPFPPPVVVPAATTSAACDGSIHAFLVENSTDTVSDISLCPLSNVKTIPVCSSPLEQALTPDGSMLLVTCYNNAIDWISTATDQVVYTLSVPNAYPAGIAMSPDGTRAYVTNYYDQNPSPSLLVIDVVKRVVLNTIPLTTSFPGVVAITPDGSQAWIDYYNSDNVDIVDLLSGTVSGGIRFSNVTQNGIAFNPTGTKAFIATGNQVAIVNTQTLQIITTINVGNSPLDVVMNPDGSDVLVGSYISGSIARIDAIQNTLVQTYTPNGGGEGLIYWLGNFPFQ
ncbi:MAG TPA: hypothetical protein VK752_16155 [Bryobacteraceae bacterium]|jgi:YVTN family beta-propeller protein|nr:hypothetical protein [Bryobacteraceae bacterium]